MSKTLAIGPFTTTEKDSLTAEFEATFLADPSALAQLDETQRAGITAVAYKGHHPFGAAQMDVLPALGIVANFGVGYDAINAKSATAKGIKITNTPDVLNDDVADLAVGMMLMQGRRLEQASQWARSGAWAAEGEFPLNRKVTGATVGILGLGRIGQEIANRLAAFKMDIHYWSRSNKNIDGYTYQPTPQALAAAVNYLVVVLVGGPDTEKMVDQSVLTALGPKGVIVNVSRGSVIDEEALLQALETGAIGGAALDVFLNEPKIDPRFYGLDNVVVQPHQGSGTVETRAAMAKLQRDNIAAFLKGAALLTPVN